MQNMTQPLMPMAKVPGIDKPVSRMVLGSMIINIQEKERSFQLLDDALECGFTTIDTAHGYAGGNSERCIGAWMTARGNRDSVVILTKGGHPNQDRRRITPHDIAADLHDSLARLQTDYVDGYMLHRDDPDQPVDMIVDTLNDHVAAGRIHAIGGSNWTHQRINQANQYARAHGLIPFTLSSPHFSLAEQVNNPWGPGCVGISGPRNKQAREWYAGQDIGIFAYSSLARGFFSGRISSKQPIASIAGIVDDACHKAYCHPDNLERLRRAELLATQKNRTVAQIAMAYVLNHPLKIFACVGAANRNELESNLEAGILSLDHEERDWLDLQI